VLKFKRKFRRLKVKTIKIPTIAPTCFGSRRNKRGIMVQQNVQVQKSETEVYPFQNQWLPDDGSCVNRNI